MLQAIIEEPDETCRELLLLLFSGTLEFNNMLCSYKGEGTGAVRPLFNHHILKPEKMALENSIWGTSKSSGCFSTLFESRILPALRYRQQPFELDIVQEKQKIRGKKLFGLSTSPIHIPVPDFHKLDSKNRALLFCQDSAQVNLPDASVDAIVSDPPYFDFVHYSELADFFYAWLQIGLKDKYPEFRAETTRSNQEVQQKDPSLFSHALKQVFIECKRVLKPAGVFVFSFHHSRNDGWLAVGNALLEAGFTIVATHPIKAEMAVASPKSQTDAPINYDAILVCKHHTTATHSTVTDAIKSTLERARRKISTLHLTHNLKLSEGDIFVITQAEALHTFSNHYNLLFDTLNKRITLRDFLNLVDTRTRHLMQKLSSYTEDTILT